MLFKTKYFWFNLRLFVGYLLEVMLFLVQVISLGSYEYWAFVIIASICMYIGPIFILSAIYYTISKLIVAHGAHYSKLPPMWYSYIFTTIDILVIPLEVVSIVLYYSQAYDHYITSSKALVITKSVIQFVEVLLILDFWFHFLFNIFFKYTKQEKEQYNLMDRSVSNFFKLLFNVSSVREYKKTQLDCTYDSKYYKVRQKTLFGWFPLALTIILLVNYIFSIFRLVETCYPTENRILIDLHLYVFHAGFIATTGSVYALFHPYFVLGKDNCVKIFNLKRNKKDESSTDTDSLEKKSGISRFATVVF
ncbi:Sphingoid long-chain base transporter RSB1 [Candida tropicalis]